MEYVTRATVVHHGRYADEHLLDATQFAISVRGTARAYDLVSFALCEGRVPGKKMRAKSFTAVQPPLAGSFATDFLIVALTKFPEIAPATPLGVEITKAAFGYAFDWLMGAVASAWQGDRSLMKQQLELIEKQAELAAQAERDRNKLINDEQARMHATIRQAEQNSTDIAHKALDILNEGLNRNGTLEKNIEDLADSTRNAARRMVEPVGRSCYDQVHRQDWSAGKSRVFTPREADIIRFEPSDEVVPASEFTVFVEALDKIRSTAKFQLYDHREVFVPADIRDPALGPVHSVYSRALDEGTPINVVAEAVLSASGVMKRMIVHSADPWARQ